MVRLRLPNPCILGNVKTTIEAYNHEKHFESLFKLCQKSTKDSQGLGEDDMDTREKVEDLTKISSTCLFLDDDKTLIEDGQLQSGLFACIILYPSNLVRSTKPALCANTFIVDSAYRSGGIGKKVMQMIPLIGADQGYFGISGRMAISARSPLLGLTMGTHFLGVIPKSLKVPTWGWVHDLIAYYDLSTFHQDKKKAMVEAVQERSEMPALKPITHGFLPTSPLKERPSKTDKTLMLRSPVTTKELEAIHKLYREAAQRGSGYALDEFTENGTFGSVLLSGAVTVGVFTADGGAVAAVVFGKSRITRVPGKCIGAYIVVDPKHQRRRLGTELLHLIEQLTKDSKLNDIMFDVLLSSQEVIQWLTRKGYIITGTSPCSGVVKHKGFTDAVLLHKNLNDKTFPFRFSNI